MSQNSSSDPVVGWLLRALVALAKAKFADINRVACLDMQWHQLPNMQQQFMRVATAQAGIPHQGYRALLARYPTCIPPSLDPQAVRQELDGQPPEYGVAIHTLAEPALYEVLGLSHARYNGRDFYGDHAADSAELAYLRDYKRWATSEPRLRVRAAPRFEEHEEPADDHPTGQPRS